MEKTKKEICHCRPYLVLLSDKNLNKKFRSSIIKNLPLEFAWVLKHTIKHLFRGRLKTLDSNFLQKYSNPLKYILASKNQIDFRLALTVLPPEFFQQITNAIYTKLPCCK